MHSIRDIIDLLIYLTKFTNKNQWRSASYNLFFIYYVCIKLNRLLKMQFKLHCIPDEIYSFLIMKHGRSLDEFVDDNLYIFSKFQILEKSKKWYFLCSKMFKKKYKVAVIFTNEIQENCIYGSETMKFNVIKHFNLENLYDSSFFLIPILEDSAEYAKEVKVSLISNPYDCENVLIDQLLKSFFHSPKYLRVNDIFSVDVKKYLPKTRFIMEETHLNTLYFNVNSMQLKNQETFNNGSFVFYGETSLIQEANVNNYLPCKCFCDIPFQVEKHFTNSFAPVFQKPIEQIQLCIAPFLQKDIYMNLKPVFLVVGPKGSKKCQIIKIIAGILGLHLLDVDCTDIRFLTAGQTETKLQKIFHEVKNCSPCILMLRNIHIFGINAEGHKDERIFLAFTTEIEKLYSKKCKYPIIIIATSDDSEIFVNLKKIFLEQISISYLNQEERYKSLSWLVESKGLMHQADLQEISKMCSNFVITDLEVLVQHALKNHFKTLELDDFSENTVIELSNEDFINAYEYMKTLISKEIGAPNIPKVYWEDIGGLADLKHEITRRIKMPLLNIPNMNKCGLLLYGPPGTGKTLLAKAVATECHLYFLSVKGPELLNMYVGQSEKNVRAVFEQARSIAPCIIFFDELDSLAPKRGQSGDGGGVMDRVVSQLLAEMDGLDSSEKIFVIAATNRPDLIDSALLRPGRFDRLLYVGICNDVQSHLNVLKVITRNFNMEKSGEELEMLVHQLPKNLTGADLYSVCSNAWLGAVRQLINKSDSTEALTANDVIVTIEDFLNAKKDLVPSVSPEDLLHYEKLREQFSGR